MRRNRVRLPALALAFLVARPSFAQDVAAAEELYNRGVADYRAGLYESACQEIGASYRLDPLPGALFTLATCEAHQGRIATAAAHYADFVQLVSRLPADQQVIQGERVQAAMTERSALVSDIPYLKITFAGEVPNGATVRRDGAVLDPTSFGRELPVDPGDHQVHAESPDGARDEQHVFLAKRERKTVVLRLTRPPPPVAASVVVPAAAIPRDTRGDARSYAPWRVFAASVAVAGLGAGTVAGLLAMNEKSVVDQECHGGACSVRGKTAADTGKTEALVSTASFGVGIGALATLAILFLVDRSSGAAHARGAVPILGFSGNALIVGAALPLFE